MPLAQEFCSCKSIARHDLAQEVLRQEKRGTHGSNINEWVFALLVNLIPFIFLVPGHGSSPCRLCVFTYLGWSIIRTRNSRPSGDHRSCENIKWCLWTDSTINSLVVESSFATWDQWTVRAGSRQKTLCCIDGKVVTVRSPIVAFDHLVFATVEMRDVIMT